MRRFLALLALIVAALPLAGCCGEELAMRSPLYSRPAAPEVVPTAYGVIQRQTAMQVVAVPVQQYAAPCAPAAAAPVYTPGFTYAAPPVGVPCR